MQIREQLEQIITVIKMPTRRVSISSPILPKRLNPRSLAAKPDDRKRGKERDKEKRRESTRTNRNTGNRSTISPLK
jgi:hypothetical protein